MKFFIVDGLNIYVLIYYQYESAYESFDAIFHLK